MDTCISQQIQADPQIIFELAAAVEDWPRILPHYRWVHVLRTLDANRRTVEMAARRDVWRGRLGFPLRWTAIETLDPSRGRIEFEHIGGITRGMHVVWSIEATSASLVRASIRHVFHPRWPVPDVLVNLIVGEYFVNGVARRTLSCLGALAAEGRFDLRGTSGHA